MKRVLPFAVFFVFACSDAPTDVGPVGLSGPQLETLGPILHSATGHGHFAHPVGEVLGARRVFSFVATEGADGTVGGEARLNIMAVGWDSQNPAITPYFQADVVCLAVSGNSARIGAIISQSSVPGNDPGDEVGWMVVDNGAGALADPDLMSLTQNPGVTTPGFAQEYCDGTVRPNPVLYALEGGDIQVR